MVGIFDRAISVLLIVCVVGLPVSSVAESSEGRILAVVDEAEAAIQILLFGIALDDEDKVHGQIDVVRVVQSNERYLELEVGFTGYEDGEFEVEILDAEKRRIPELQRARYQVPAAVDESRKVANITFRLPDDIDEGFEIRSSRVKLSVRRHSKRTVQAIKMYALDKVWKPVISPENLVVRVTPSPIGETGAWVQSLSQSPPSSPPSHPVDPAPPPQSAIGRIATLAQPLQLRPVTAQAMLGGNAPRLTRRPVQATSDATRIAAAKVVRSRNLAAIEKLPIKNKRVAISNYKFSQARPQSNTSTEASYQVGNASVDLLSQLQFESGVDFNMADILGVSRQVYPDSNPASGVFYYVPRAYRLSYDRDLGGSRGLGFRITYDRIGDNEKSRTVRMAASFDSGVDLGEIQLAEKILTALDRNDASFTFTPPLRPFPLAAPPQFDFSGALSGHVDSDQIAVVALSDTLEGIDVSWSTDPISAQNIRRDLRDGTPITGIAGFDSPGPEVLRLAMPARVDITDPKVYEAMYLGSWEREATLRNNSPLPIVLKYFHALVIEGNKPRLYSWSMDDTPLPASSALELDLQHVPVQVDQKAERTWIQYSLDRRCDSCIDGVVENLLSADVWPDTGSLLIRSLTPLEMTGASEIWVDVRSRFFDPSDRDVIDGSSIIIAEDRGSYEVEPVFLTSRLSPESGEEWPLFEYRLTVVMPSGEVHEGEGWIESNRKNVVIGPVQIDKSLGFIPSAE